ncbi:uncharacterized protein MAM_06281 [Metarhizium album ARSEF 1941]|uniref:Uncharacterized protein n=1 Tax=Metarhizium album (strain ARSEF 1941) TaxID=1081103 RepID=A0A0B2WQJ1_METAS|nr:uncharacterized protein MAM_06281 [Metarhizium album ARSEF 1941]KHN95919.1 hypothetical protein MAM_06281 [Metarhizium album ARSEF 1941]
MPLEQTITIVNNSGKIISTGKQLFSIFKEAKTSYDEKKAEIRGVKRSETFDQPQIPYQYDDYPRSRGHRSHSGRSMYEPEYYTEYDYNKNPGSYDGRLHSFDVYSEAGSRRSHHTPRPHSRYYQRSPRNRPALTEDNLKALSEISSTTPSKPPMAYRSPYAETLPKDMAVSRMDLTQYDMNSVAEDEWRRSALLRRAPESQIARQDEPKDKEIDMNLAYGNIPPDLEFRVDLDPSQQTEEQKANQLIRKVEGLLDEAHCLQHSATSTIKHLQQKPDAAAAVALTLAELSSVVGKMSPALLGFLKGGSPAVFALLASPQFLIGTGIAVGLTVVMFGGWKIVQRVKESQVPREAIAYGNASMDQPAPLRTQSDYNASFDEALIVDEELSTIESWRRGIMPFGADNESADIELITPEAERAQREKYKDDFDHGSFRSARTERSTKTVKTTKTSKTAKTTKPTRSQKTSSKDKDKDKDKDKEREVPERRSSRNATVESISGDSESGRHRSSRKHKEKERPRERGVKMIEDGRSNSMDLVYRPKAQRQGDNMLKALFKNKDKHDKKAQFVVA